MIAVVVCWLIASPLVGLWAGKRLKRRAYLTLDAIEAADFPTRTLHPQHNGDTK